MFRYANAEWEPSIPEAMFALRTGVTSTYGGLKIRLTCGRLRHAALKILLREGEAERR
jgi:hypothetical protein